MEEIDERLIDEGVAEQSPSRTRSIIIAGVVIILIILFLKWQSSSVKTPSQSEKTSIKQVLKPITINEKPDAEIFMDIKIQLMEAFK